MPSSTLLRAAVRHQAKNTLRQPRDKKRAESTDRLPALFRLLIRLVFRFVIPGTVAAASIILELCTGRIYRILRYAAVDKNSLHPEILGRP